MKEIKFIDYEIRGVNVPLKEPIQAHIGTFYKWPYLCLDIKTDSEIVGKSYIGPYLVEQLPSIASCIKALSTKFKGRVIQPSQFYKEGVKALSLLGFQGIGIYALASLDIAFWDAHAKAYNSPLAVHLGGSLKPLKAYNSRGLWLKPINELANDAKILREEGGFNTIKLRIGREDARDDIKAFNEVKRGAGSDIKILSDFNQCFTLPEAMRRMKMLDEVGFEWFEEPIKYNDFLGCSKLCQMISTPITIGENFHGPKDLKDAIDYNACDMIMPDLMRIGGVSGWLKSAAIAEVNNMDLSSHLFPEVSAHLMSVTPTADWTEWVDWANPIIKDPYQLKDGHIIIPDKPGTGIDWNEENLEKYAIPL